MSIYAKSAAVAAVLVVASDAYEALRYGVLVIGGLRCE